MLLGQRMSLINEPVPAFPAFKRQVQRTFKCKCNDTKELMLLHFLIRSA